MGSNCPSCGSSKVTVSETATTRTHTCKACGYSETVTKGKTGRLFAVASVALATAFGLLLLFGLATWTAVSR